MRQIEKGKIWGVKKRQKILENFLLGYSYHGVEWPEGALFTVYPYSDEQPLCVSMSLPLYFSV